MILVSNHTDVVIQFWQRTSVVGPRYGCRIEGRIQVALPGDTVAASYYAHEEIDLALIDFLRPRIDYVEKGGHWLRRARGDVARQDLVAEDSDRVMEDVAFRAVVSEIHDSGGGIGGDRRIEVMSGSGID